MNPNFKLLCLNQEEVEYLYEIISKYMNDMSKQGIEWQYTGSKLLTKIYKKRSEFECLKK